MRKLSLKLANFIAILAVIIALSMLFNMDAMAQCPMCKAAAEQNLANGGTAAKGLNKGIFYLLATPYLLALTIGGMWWYKNHRGRVEV